MKGLVFALKDWTIPYESLPIGSINPENIVFNSDGQIKLIHLFSFPPDRMLALGNQFYAYK